MPLPSPYIATASSESSPATAGLSRRQFASMALAGGACFALPAALAAEENKEGGWIDAHVHVWTPDTQRYPLAEGFDVSDMQPPSFTPEQLFAHTTPAGVTRVVLIQMSYYGFDNRYMLDTIARYPETFSGVAIVDSQAADVAQQIAALVEKGVRGLRIHPGPGEAARWVRDEGMATLWTTAAGQDIAVCPLINPTDLPHVDAMCGKFPATRVVVDHFARIGMDGQIDPRQLDALCRLARHPQLYVKTSAFYALGKKQPPYVDLIPMILRLIDTFGSQRLMWASDCPFQVQGEHTYAASIALIRDRINSLSAADKQAILRDTAQEVFFSPR